MNTNDITYKVRAGNLEIGGGVPVSVQTMWKRPLLAGENIIEELTALKALGCDIIRFSVPDMECAEILSIVAAVSPIPVVADIHFDHKIALRCMDFNINKIRINPGNIGAEWKVKEVLMRAKERNIPIRVGINSGSLPVMLRKEKDIAGAMLLAAEEEINLFEKYNFMNGVFSLKSSNVDVTVEANTMFAEKYAFPLHLGITEAGPLIQGIVKNTAGILPLLEKNIGATIRVSLSANPEDEIIAGKSILNMVKGKNRYADIISCPKCGRASFDVHSFIQKLYIPINTLKKPATIAIMGCIVNGPKEAQDADLGITGAGDSIVIFKKGEIIKKTTAENAEKDFMEEINTL